MKAQVDRISPEMIAERLAAIEPQAVEALAQYWEEANLPPHYPADTGTVAELMDANGYRCSRGSIQRMLNERVIPSPARRSGRFTWSAANILALQMACEDRRRWKPFSRFHVHKLTQYEKLQEIAQENGAKSCFSDMATFDESGLIALLHDQAAANLGVRQALAAALTEKLRSRGIDI